MKADLVELPAGQSLRKVRDFLDKNGGYYRFDRDTVSDYFGADITDELLAKGLIEWEGELFSNSLLGQRVANMRLIPRISRAKADKIVVEMLERARAINANDEMLYRIKRITAFGSYVGDAADLGDIDLFVELERKANWSSEACHARAEAVAPYSARIDFFKRLRWVEIEPLRMLKASNRYISLVRECDEYADHPKKIIFEDVKVK